MEISLTNYPPENIVLICEKMETSDLINFMKTSWRNYDLCKNEWNKRHRITYGEHYLTSQQRNYIKTCLKNKHHVSLFLEIGRYLGNNKVNPEILQSYNFLDEMYSPLIEEIDNKYGEDAAIFKGVYWDEDLWIEKNNEITIPAYQKLVDSLHSDESLFQLASIVED